MDRSIFDAIVNNDLNTLQTLMRQGVAINTPDTIGRTPLMLAVYYDRADIVRLLITAGVDINAQAEHGITALMLSTRSDNVQIAKILIDSGANPDMQNAHGNTTLLLALKKGPTSVAAYLIQVGANVNIINNLGETALTKAASWQYLLNSSEYENIIQALILCGADVNHQDSADQTALMLSAKYDHDSHNARTARMLIQHGARFDMQDVNGNTALLLAFEEGGACVAEYLIQAGANINIANNFGEIALTKAASWGHEHIVQVLIERNVSVNHQEHDGRTALMYAAEVGVIGVIKQLLTANACLNIKDQDGTTALMYACSEGRKDIVHCFLEKNVDILAQNNRGQTAVMFAHDMDIFKLLQHVQNRERFINIRTQQEYIEALTTILDESDNAFDTEALLDMKTKFESNTLAEYIGSLRTSEKSLFKMRVFNLPMPSDILSQRMSILPHKLNIMLYAYFAHSVDRTKNIYLDIMYLLYSFRVARNPLLQLPEPMLRCVFDYLYYQGHCQHIITPNTDHTIGSHMLEYQKEIAVAYKPSLKRSRDKMSENNNEITVEYRSRHTMSSNTTSALLQDTISRCSINPQNGG